MRIEGIEEAEFKYLEQYGGKIPELSALVGLMKEKVALIFTEASVYDLKISIEANKLPTEARIGVVSPVDFSVPAGPTGLDPSQINFFHALNISTKIVKGQIEITKDFKVCTIGKKVKASEAALLKKLNFKPFQYGMKIFSVYDEGAILPQAVLDLNPATLLTKFELGAKNMIGLSLETGYPIAASIPMFIGSAFKNIAALSLESGYFIFNVDTRSRKLKPSAVDPPLRLKSPRNRARRKPKSRKLPPHQLKRTRMLIWEACSDDRI